MHCLVIVTFMVVSLVWLIAGIRWVNRATPHMLVLSVREESVKSNRAGQDFFLLLTNRAAKVVSPPASGKQ
jgi:hypothetical protein